MLSSTIQCKWTGLKIVLQQVLGLTCQDAFIVPLAKKANCVIDPFSFRGKIKILPVCRGRWPRILSWWGVNHKHIVPLLKNTVGNVSFNPNNLWREVACQYQCLTLITVACCSRISPLPPKMECSLNLPTCLHLHKNIIMLTPTHFCEPWLYYQGIPLTICYPR